MKIKDLGPCQIKFNGVDLGATKGGVFFRYSEETRPVNEDQKGITEVDGIGVGVTLEVEAPLTRTQMAKLATVIGAASYSGNRFRVRNRVGFSLYDAAKELVLTRMSENAPSENPEDILTVFKAYPRPDLEFVYDNENQQVAKVIFKCFPDSATNLLWQIGA